MNLKFYYNILKKITNLKSNCESAKFLFLAIRNLKAVFQVMLASLILSSCSLSGKISSLDPSKVEPVSSSNSLSLKVQNSTTNQVSLDEGTLILASAILDKARKKDLNITVRISSAQGNARVQERFSSYTQSVKIPAGSTSAFISIQTTDDVIAQGADEEFTLSIFPDEDSKGDITESSSFVTLIIRDNESVPTLSFQSASQNKNEDAGSGLVNLELSQVSTSTVSVRVSAVDVTAAAGTDYSYSSQVISFAPGEVSKPVSFSLTNRSGVQASRSFKFQLSDVNNAVITTNATGTNTKEHAVTIIDVDQASLSVNDVSVNEGSNATVTVSLSTAYTSSVSVDYALTAVSAVAGSDYTAASGTVTIAAGQTSASITVSTLTNAGVCEADKTLKVVLSNPVNATIGDSEGVVTIRDITNPVVSLGASTHSVTEGSSTSLAVNLSAVCSTRNVSVEYSTSAGTATATTDYAPASAATLTINAGDSSGTIAIPTTSDTLDENDETFTVTIASPTNATLGATTSAVVTITDDDAAPSVTLATSSSSISEGGTSVTLTATLSAASAKAVSLPFTVTGTATSTSDYTLSASSPLTIAAGATTATLTLTVVDDSDLEGDETVIVSLDTPTNASLGATTSQTVTITDNDLGSFNISGITGENESTSDANLSNGLNPKINWGSSSGATGYKVSVVSDDGSTTVCAEQTVSSVQTYQYSLTDCTLTAGTYYRARVKATLGALEQSAGNTSYRFYVNNSPSLASNGEGPWYVMAGSSIVINAAGGSSPTIGVASDADGDAFEFTATGSGTLGTVTTGTSSFTYAATSGTSNHGRDSVTYTITDARGGTRTGTIYIHVVQATTWTGSSSNVWNTNANWCGAVATGNRACANSGTAPVSSAARAYIDDTCTQNCSPATHASFTIGGLHMKGSTLNIQSSHTLTVSTNPIVQTAGTINISGTLYVNDKSVTVTGTGNWIFNAGSKVVFYLQSAGGIKQLTIPSSVEFNDVDFVGSSNAINIYNVTNKLTVKGTLTFSGAHNLYTRWNTFYSGEVDAYGNVNLTAYGFGGGILNIKGNSTITGATNAWTGDINFDPGAGNTVTLSGTFKPYSSSWVKLSGNIEAAGSLVNFISSNNEAQKNINLPNVNMNNVTFSGSAGGTVRYNLVSDLIVNGTLTLSGADSDYPNDWNKLYQGNILAYGDVNYTNYGVTTGVVYVKTNGKTVNGTSNVYCNEIRFDSGSGNTVILSGFLRFQSNLMAINSGSVDAGSSTIEFSSANKPTKTMDLSAIAFNNLKFSGSSGSTVRYIFNNGLNVNGTLTFSGSNGEYPHIWNMLYEGEINAYGDVSFTNYGNTSGILRLKGVNKTVTTSTSNTYVNQLYFESGAGNNITLSGIFKVYSDPWTYVSGNVDATNTTVEFYVRPDAGSDTLDVSSIAFNNVTFVGSSGGTPIQYSIIGSLNVYGNLTFSGSESAVASWNRIVSGTINAYKNITINSYGVSSNLTLNWLDLPSSSTSTLTSTAISGAHLPLGTININRNHAAVQLASNVSLNPSFSGSPSINIVSGTLDMNGYNLTAPKGITNAGTILRQGSGASCGTITGTVTGNAATCP